MASSDGGRRVRRGLGLAGPGPGRDRLTGPADGTGWWDCWDRLVGTAQPAGGAGALRWADS